MTNPENGLRQMDEAETAALAELLFEKHRVRLMPHRFGRPVFQCSCGEGFPATEVVAPGFKVRYFQHIDTRLQDEAKAIGGVPSARWLVPFGPRDAAASVDEPDRDLRAVPLWAMQDAVRFLRTVGDKREHLLPIGLINLFDDIVAGQATGDDLDPPVASVRDSDIPVFGPACPVDLIEVSKHVRELLALISLDEYPVVVRTAIVERAEAFLAKIGGE